MTHQTLFRRLVTPLSRRAPCLMRQAAVIAAVAAIPLHAWADTTEGQQSMDRGYDYVLENCSGCHAIGAEGESLHIDAPPFRYIGRLYPIDHLAESFAEGTSVGHPDMPEFVILEPQQIKDLLAYLKSIQE